MIHRVSPPEALVRTSHCNEQEYETRYRQSLVDPDGFWREQMARIDWLQPPSRISGWSYDPVEIRWFEDGILNLCCNCVDRHLEARADQVAILFEGDEPGTGRSLTYGDLYREVVAMANSLKSLGVTKGDRVTLYMPMIPEAAVAMLACARIGAVHSIVFGGFSPEALHGRIEDCASRFVVTADGGLRGGRLVPLKANVDAAIAKGAEVDAVLVVRHLGNDIAWTQGRDHWLHDMAPLVPEDCPPEPMNAEDPLFILYTSGSTGKPKGVLHTTGGYAVWTATTFHYVFDYKQGEVFWCTADVGWVTGHSYVVYGPLANGATTLMFEGVPNHPDFSRFWDVVERHKVNIFYTAPTAIRALMREGEGPVQRHDRSSLRLLGTVGEPINPEAWRWYWQEVGEARCPVVDTWWQTETGGIMITTLPGAHDMKPGSAGRPFFGIEPQLVGPEGELLDGAASGNLCIARSWPGQMRTVYGDHERFVQTYFSTYRGKYFTGDGCRRDEDGYYWITRPGRRRPERLGPQAGHGGDRIRSGAAPCRREAAVVGYPHDIKGQGIYCYVTLIAGRGSGCGAGGGARQFVRKEIGPIATPDLIHFTPALPKTRPARSCADSAQDRGNEFGALGDTSTLADPSLIDSLVEGRRNR
jgi:acetyl-CoA synthetase